MIMSKGTDETSRFYMKIKFANLEFTMFVTVACFLFLLKSSLSFLKMQPPSLLS